MHAHLLQEDAGIEKADGLHLSARRDPESFILTPSSFLDTLLHLDIKPEGGTYIYSALRGLQ